MEVFVIVLVGLAIGGYAYRSGKRDGSRSGFFAGRCGRKRS